MNLKLILTLAATVAFFVAPAASAYTPLTEADGDELQPDPYISGNVTIANHKLTCSDEELCFHGDDNDLGDLADYGFALHSENVDEPIQFTPAKVDVQYYAEDSDKKSIVSAWGKNISNKAWLDLTQWTATKESNDTWEVAVRNGAHAIHIASPALAGAGDTDTDTYVLDFTDITTDVNKIRMVLGIEIVSLGTAPNAAVYVAAYDGNATGVNVFDATIDSALKADGTTQYFANSTGTVFWDELVTEGRSVLGGVTGDIGKIQIELNSKGTTASEVFIFALGLEVSRYSFGKDDNGDSVHNMTYTDCEGVARSTPLGYTCLADFDPSFDYQNVKDLKVAYLLEASALPISAVDIMGAETDDDAFPWETNFEFTFELPIIIDLTYAGDEALKYVLPVTGAQHEVVKVGGTDKIKDVEKKRMGDTVTLSSSLANKKTELELTIVYTQSQLDAVSEQRSVGGLFGPKNPITAVLVWLSSVAGVGVVAAKLLTRKQKSG